MSMKNLKDIRLEKGLSIRKVSKMTGLSQAFIARAEAGEKCSTEKYEIYALALGCIMVPLQLGKSYLVTAQPNGVTRVDYSSHYSVLIAETGAVEMFCEVPTKTWESASIHNTTIGDLNKTLITQLK